MVVKIKKFSEEVKIPSYAYLGDAAFDLCAKERTEVLSGERKLIGAGIALEIPQGYAGLIWDKSSVSMKGIKTLVRSD